MIYPGSLHTHTDMSNWRLRDCIIKLSDLIKYAKELNYKAIAITDHESIGNWVKAEKLAKANPEIKIIRGNEIYLCRDGLNVDNFNKEQDKYYHFLLLAKDLIGAHQIMELSTRAWERSYVDRGMRRVPTYYQDLLDIVHSNPGHIIASTACLGGFLPTQLMRYATTENESIKDNIFNWLKCMVEIFGNDNFYLELQPSKTQEQTYVNKALISISEKLSIPYIITLDAHYLKKEDREIHKAYLNSDDGDREVDEFYSSTYLMDDTEINKYLTYLSQEQIEIAYSNINDIIDKCEDYSILKPLKIPTLKWKEHIIHTPVEKWYDVIPMFETFMSSDYEGDKELCKAIIEGIESKPDLQNKRAYDEINSNLEMTWISSNVNKAHWSAYYLNLQNIIDICWNAGSLVGCGRGSGVGFLLLYTLGITQINPLKETTRCFAWRFLNPERVSVLD